MARFLLIAVAGGVGTSVRYLVSLWAGKTLGSALPYGTLMVNLVGCFLIAAVAHAALVAEAISPTLRLTLTTGFIGGLTTYSSFNLETTQFLQTRAWYAAFLNLGVTLIGCFIAGLLGLALARRVYGP
jgi:fluoride exporter